MNEIILGEYTVSLICKYLKRYNVWRNEILVGVFDLTTDDHLTWIQSLDTDLITILLLKYNVTADFHLYRSKLT